MKSISKVIAGLVLLGLLAVGMFSFGDQGIIANTLQKKQDPADAVETTNKITVAELTNEKVVPVDNTKSDVVLNTFISAPNTDLIFDHLLNAREFEGAVVYASNEPVGLNLRVEAPVNLSSAELPEAISGHETPFQNGSQQKQAQIFNNYPIMLLTASSLKKIESNSYVLNGLFSLHGVSRPIKLPVTLEEKDGLIHMRGEFSFLQSDYSIAAYNTDSHTTLNKDKVVLKFNLSACAK